MSTRVTNAIASRKARENLVRLLFPKDHSTVDAGTSSPAVPSTLQAHHYHDTDRHSHNRRRRRRMGDGPSNVDDATGRQKRHTYSQLRAAYLQRAHAMHPDKTAHQSGRHQSTGNEMMSNYKNNAMKNSHLEFIELKNAWEEYHASVRIVKRHNDDRDSSNCNQQYSEDDFWEEEDSFTLFGVGCSFADSPEERVLRNEIMEQASRGWFSSGLISSSEGRIGGHDSDNEGTLERGDTPDLQDLGGAKSDLQPQMKLSDDDMFVCCDQSAAEDCSKRKYLVQNVEKFRRKR